MARKSVVSNGMFFNTKHGSIEIVEYHNSHNVQVKFINTGTLLRTKTSHILSGEIRDPYAKTLKGIGVCGQKYPTTLPDGGFTKSYSAWIGMFERCYGDTKSSASYKSAGITIDERFHSYERFHEFYEKLQNSGKSLWNLDKDLFFNGKYSPESVCMLPREINVAMTTQDSRKTSGLPAGVKRSGDKFIARHRMADKEKHLGTFNSVEDASRAYIKAKKEWVVFLAARYSSELPDKVLRALLEWVPR